MASKRVTLEEYLASKGAGGVERKSFARESGVVLKALPPSQVEKARFDADAGTVRFVMSAEVEDRDNDIVVQAGLDTTQFEKNPVAPWAHRSGEPPVGQWSDLEKVLTGRPKRTEGTLTLTKGEPQADRLAIHLAAGSIRACSIGFMPTSIERRDVPEDKKDTYFWPGYIIHEAELYECSPCSIPANPAALAKAAAEGDALSRELIQQILDCWDLKYGLIIPRKALEDAHRAATGHRTLVVIGEKRFMAALDDKGEPSLSLIEPSDGERLVDTLSKDMGLLARLGELIGFQVKPEKTAEQISAERDAAHFAEITAKHDMVEADARLAQLDAEMGQHVPA